MMERYIVKKIQEPPHLRVSVPGSKSITNRALLMAAVAEGTTILKGVQFSDDSMKFLQALKDLGFEVREDVTAKTVVVHGCGGHIPKEEATIYVGSAGTAARFLTAFLAMGKGHFTLRASQQMMKRPMKELLVVLEGLGAKFTWLDKPYAFPFEVDGIGNKPGDFRVQLNIDESSQFLSALLMTAPLSMDSLTIELTGTRNARSYVEMTEQMMRQFGHPGVKKQGADCYEVTRHTYQPQEYTVEPDVSAACYFYAVAAITGGSAIVNHMKKDSLQGDMKFLDVLVRMGCKQEWMEQDGECLLKITGPKMGQLQGVDVTMSDFSDQTLTLAAIAPYANSPVIIRGVGHIRGQESDRLLVIETQLRRMGISCQMTEDGIRIEPGQPKGVEVETYEDHRVAMSFAITGLLAEGMVILNPGCCRKTFAEYFDVFEKGIYA